MCTKVFLSLCKFCNLVQQVEVWLNRVLEAMCATVCKEMNDAVTSYEEKPREQWLFDFPAQVALAGTQIWWTTEVNIAFGRLEEGYENALKVSVLYDMFVNIGWQSTFYR